MEARISAAARAVPPEQITSGLLTVRLGVKNL